MWQGKIMNFDAESLKQILIKHYGDNIAVRKGNSELYTFDPTFNKKSKWLFAAYIHTYCNMEFASKKRESLHITCIVIDKKSNQRNR